jgi:tetratricopeptide (TPR) repeat protein
MKKTVFFIKIIIIYSLTFLQSFAQTSSFFDEGVKLFNNNEIEKSKIFFQKDIVLNPKSEKSYLYLSKIFEKNNNDDEQEINLKNVLLINPKNDEAIYKLTILKIKQSDYKYARKLINDFSLVCESFCIKKDEMEEKLKKILPEDE